MKPKTIRVIAAPGRRVPLHSSIATGPGGAMVYVSGDKPVELPDASYVRRRMRAGDLIAAPAVVAPIAPPVTVPAPIVPAPPAPAPAPAPESPKKEP